MVSVIAADLTPQIMYHLCNKGTLLHFMTVPLALACNPLSTSDRDLEAAAIVPGTSKYRVVQASASSQISAGPYSGHDCSVQSG